MNRIAGKGGNVFAIADVFSFAHIPMYGSDDGWSWYAPDGLGCWEGDVLFEVSDGDGGWEEIEPDEVYPHIGRAVFPRSLTGRRVRASGECRPTTLIGWGKTWRILIDTEISTSPGLGRPNGADVQVLSTVATVDGVIAPPLSEAFVMLPFQKGAYVGVGELTQMQVGVKITFPEGVTYESCN